MQQPLVFARSYGCIDVKSKRSRMSEAGFVAFATAEVRDLLRFAYLTSGSQEEAADLVQEALASAYVRWSRVERLASPTAYVRKIIVNRHISSWRRHRGRVITGIAYEEETTRDTDRVDDRQVIVGLLRELPRKQRVAVVLRYFADQSDEEIADALGCAPSTVRSQISRALAALRRAELSSRDMAQEVEEQR
jgi:RNA polymerase sigma-70 factor (sigma-E family)